MSALVAVANATAPASCALLLITLSDSGLTVAEDCRCSSRAGMSSRPVETPAYQGAAGVSPRVACRPLLVLVVPVV